MALIRKVVYNFILQHFGLFGTVLRSSQMKGTTSIEDLLNSNIKAALPHFVQILHPQHLPFSHSEPNFDISHCSFTHSYLPLKMGVG